MINDELDEIAKDCAEGIADCLISAEQCTLQLFPLIRRSWIMKFQPIIRDALSDAVNAFCDDQDPRE